MKTDRREVNRQPPVQLYSPFHSVNELRDVGMAGVEARVGVDDANNGTGEGVFAVAHCFNEELAHEEREVSITVRW